jgi:predicted dehydrogenase
MNASKLRLIQCGMGGMGRAWWKGATSSSPDFQTVAIVDVASDPLAEAGDALQIPSSRRFESLAAALDAGVEADAVLTVTPPPVHVEHAELAFSRGLHLLTEKPIAHDLLAAKRMVRLAREADRQLVVAQNYRYSAPMQRLMQLARDQIVGPIGHGHIDFYIPADFTGTFREQMQFPLLVDMAIHHIDLIRAVTGRDITRVTASTFNPSWSWYGHHAGLKMLLELEGDVHFSYSGDWSAIGKCTSWNGAWRLQCSSGSIHLDEENRIFIGRCEKWLKNPSIEQMEIPPVEFNGQAELLRRFAQAIRTGVPAETSGEDNLRSFAGVMAAVISATERRAVEMSEMLSAP